MRTGKHSREISRSNDTHLVPSYSSEFLEKKLPEWGWLQRILPVFEKWGELEHLGFSRQGENTFPLIAIKLGSKDPSAPVLGLFAGVHGLERIGSQVCLALLQSFSELLLWDPFIQQSLEKIRIVAFPLINPIGMINLTRCNPNGVDLMRNAPVDGVGKVTYLVGGQRISNRLPWYRGDVNKMEPENEALLAFCQREFFQSRATIAVDFHSGFGFQDQLWFPYARSTEPFPHLGSLWALKEVLDRTYPHHIYKIEPQAKNYTTHGDMWDYIYDLHRQQNQQTFLPLALEMGSWNWVRKNPWQIFNPLGPYNPLKPHRQKRTFRRHLTLFDFFIRTLQAPEMWANLSPEENSRHFDRARAHWGFS